MKDHAPLSAVLSATVSAVATLSLFAIGSAAPLEAGVHPALRGLMPFATLLSTPQGRAVLDANYAVTAGIQTGSLKQPLLMPFADQQQQALKDAFITRDNAAQLADGLGTALGQAYADKAKVFMDANGKPAFTAVAPSVTTLLRYANITSGLDSEAGKYFFANATTNGTTPASPDAVRLLTEAGGTTDVLGKAYGKQGGSPGADPYGDSRPFQTEKPFIYYDGTDYLGASVSSHSYLDQPPHQLTKSPAYPSGHTTYGYTESLLLALMVPERFQQMVTRGAEYGNDRILLGAHYAVDVIGGRTLALYDLAQELANKPGYVGRDSMGVAVTDFPATLQQATKDLRASLEAGCGAPIATCATRDDSRFANLATDKAFVAATQDYGLPVLHATTAGKLEDLRTLAPEAGHLLATRFPYLDLLQRDDVLTSTESAGGGFLDNGSAFGAFSRIDLFRAADGYAVFSAPTTITMDAGKGGFHAADTFRNDIAGAGGLTLAGSGRLTLAGHDSYTGPTIVEGGSLVVTGSLRSPVTVRAGATLIGDGALGQVTVAERGTFTVRGRATVAGALALAAGSTLDMRRAGLAVAGAAAVEGATLRLAATDLPKAKTALISAEGGVTGRFGVVTVEGGERKVALSYDASHVYAETADAHAGPGAGTTAR